MKHMVFKIRYSRKLLAEPYIREEIAYVRASSPVIAERKLREYIYSQIAPYEKLVIYKVALSQVSFLIS